MGTFEAAKPIMLICARDRVRAVAFYRDMLGLTMTLEDNFAGIFNVAGVDFRVSDVPDFVANEHTALGLSRFGYWRNGESTSLQGRQS